MFCLLRPHRSLLTTTKLYPKSCPASYSTTTNTTLRKVAARIPPDSWDSHMHVTDPRYPLAPNAAYTPPLHTLSDALALTSGAYNIRNLVFVQPSIYGADNSCLLSALRELGPQHGRGVVGIDPSNTSASTMHEWHALGVRGVRLNLKSVGRAPDVEQLRAELVSHAAAIPPALRAGGGGWVLQVYCSLDAVPLLERIVEHERALPAGVKLCIDHFGHPASLPPWPPASSSSSSSALPDSKTSTTTTVETQGSPSQPDPYALPGFAALMRLLQAGGTWVKLSAAYRIEQQDAGLPWLGAMARELLGVRGGGRCVFATDWPHTRFEGVDVEPFVEKCLEWCGGDAVKVQRLFRDNAEELWDVAR
ncbi:hypothetical protein DBV05_g8476 [Lasiodiplodia theobromae]|uniref:Amidohydrolase-related domain-containing protein n=1 Tax=Lasiodiplodia theobromae TaxID=45133 RepID=A0A5N5D5S1_9PEZI|nr:hypothetical protein DBV05_g8476 [Lasiodiplodia theobromae]